MCIYKRNTSQAKLALKRGKNMNGGNDGNGISRPILSVITSPPLFVVLVILRALLLNICQYWLKY